jgi:GntR family transcriptional regulator
MPYLIGTSYVDQRLIDELGIGLLNQMSVLKFINQSRRLKVAGGTQTIHIDTSDAEVSYQLHLPLNAPIFIIRRAVYDQHSILIYQSRGLFRGDFIRVTRKVTLRSARPTAATAS